MNLQVRITNPAGKIFFKSGMVVRVPPEYMKIIELKRKVGKGAKAENGGKKKMIKRAEKLNREQKKEDKRKSETTVIYTFNIEIIK